MSDRILFFGNWRTPGLKIVILIKISWQSFAHKTSLKIYVFISAISNSKGSDDKNITGATKILKKISNKFNKKVTGSICRKY